MDPWTTKSVQFFKGECSDPWTTESAQFFKAEAGIHGRPNQSKFLKGEAQGSTDPETIRMQGPRDG